MQQMYSCPTCHQQVSYGVRFCANCGNPLAWEQRTSPLPIYQQPVNYQQQVPPYYQQHPSYPRQQQDRMNWFQRHLNWTLVIVILVGGMLAGYTDLLFFPWRLLIIPITLFGVITVIWYLRRKNRGVGWWLLIMLLGAAGASQSRSSAGIALTETFIVVVFLPGLIGLCLKNKLKNKKQLEVKGKT